MPRISSISILSVIWLCSTACQDSASKADAPPTKVSGDAKPAQDFKAQDPAATGPVVPAPPEGGFSEEPSPPSEEVPGPAPAWFRADAFEHTAIIRQDLAGTRVPTGQTSAMIVLELPASTTPEQCIEQFKLKIAETVKDPPTAGTVPQGHLSLHGKTDSYEYTVVCGLAKGKPTMFLSYTQ